MDEEMRAFLEGMMGQINGRFDLILDQLSAMRADMETTRGHVLYGLQENLTLSQRISKIEDELRRR